MKTVGWLGSLLLATLLVAILTSMISRSLFSTGGVIVEDVILYAYGALIPCSLLFASLRGKHIRAHMGNTVASNLRNALENSLTIAVFAGLFVLSAPVVLEAWRVMEGSREIGGLPGFFLVKTLMPIVFLAIAFTALRARLAGKS